MILITNEQALRQYIPNVVAVVKGETPFINKLAPSLEIAEQWIADNFTGQEILKEIGASDDTTLRNICCNLVVSEAFRIALPSLDVVLTPNGFGIVSTGNLAPASQHRIENLRAGLVETRDNCIALLVRRLSSHEDWRDTEPGRYFGATLFPFPDNLTQFDKETTRSWERYQKLRPRLIDLESSLAEEWFSPELMAALRKEYLSGEMSSGRKLITEQIQAHIVAYFKYGTLHSRRLADIVNYIRQRDDMFPEWHRSETAKLFAPPVFRNEKKSAGYFF